MICTRTYWITILLPDIFSKPLCFTPRLWIFDIIILSYFIGTWPKLRSIPLKGSSTISKYPLMLFCDCMVFLFIMMIITGLFWYNIKWYENKECFWYVNMYQVRGFNWLHREIFLALIWKLHWLDFSFGHEV